MKVLVEATWEKDETGDEGETLYEKDLFFLLHWGTDYTIIETDDKTRSGVSYTIAICEHRESGAIRCFSPEQIRILGRDIKG